jgi:3-oxoacyl-[acyl-carrier-protein] synthase-3
MEVTLLLDAMMSRATIAAVEYHLPALSLTNEQLAVCFPEWPASKIEEKLGIKRRAIAANDECSSDLAVAAALRLFDTCDCVPSEIDFVLFCTQTPDYVLPTTACLIQARLGIRKAAGALDFNLGCSGYVYGLGLAKGLVETGQAANVLLLTGETYSKLMHPTDKATRTLFGDAGSATWVKAVGGDYERIGPFVYGTDGSGAEDLIVRQGGMRHPGTPLGDSKGLCMNGGEIFTFGQREVSKSMDALMAKADVTMDAIDLFVFHQANAYMLEFLRKKCRIPEDKFYTWYESSGNTVSNTIPIALHHAMDDGRIQPGNTVMLVGFGVGLSWGACLARF